MFAPRSPPVPAAVRNPPPPPPPQQRGTTVSRAPCAEAEQNAVSFPFSVSFPVCLPACQPACQPACLPACQSNQECESECKREGTRGGCCCLKSAASAGPLSGHFDLCAFHFVVQYSYAECGMCADMGVWNIFRPSPSTLPTPFPSSCPTRPASQSAASAPISCVHGRF